MVITIAHAKGGVGKTTVALNIAALLKPHLIIDQDQHFSINVLNEIRAEKHKVMAGHSAVELIDELKRSVDNLVLIDCGGYDSDLNRKAIAASDLLIVPSSEDPTEVIGLNTFNDTLASINKDFGTSVIGQVLFVKFDPRQRNFESFDSMVGSFENLRPMKSRLAYYADFRVAMRFGLGVTEHKKTKYSRASSSVAALVDEIKTNIEGV